MTRDQLKHYKLGMLAAARMVRAELEFVKRARAAAPNQASVEALDHAADSAVRLREAIRQRAQELVQR